MESAKEDEKESRELRRLLMSISGASLEETMMVSLVIAESAIDATGVSWWCGDSCFILFGIIASKSREVYLSYICGSILSPCESDCHWIDFQEI